MRLDVGLAVSHWPHPTLTRRTQAAQFADAKASTAASELAAIAALAAVVSLTALVQHLLAIISRIQKRLHMK